MIQIKNKSILLVDDNEEILTMVRTFIEFDFEVEIIEAKSGNQAIELLKEENNFGLIISDHQMPNGSGEDLFKYVEKNIEIPFILSSGNLPTSDLKEAILAHNPSNKILVKPFNFEVLLSELENILNDSNDESEEKYAKIPLHFFMNHQDYKNEVFIRTGENKFVKIVNAGDSLDIEQAERFQEKSVSHLYMEKNSSIEYLNMIFETILKDSPSQKNKESHFESIEAIRIAVMNLGISKSTIDFTDKLTKNIMEESSLTLESIDFANKAYSTSLSLIINYFVCAIVKEIPWGVENLIKKLIYSSLLCNISLENDHEVKIQSENEEAFNLLSNEEKKSVLEHTKESAKIASNPDSFSSDVEAVILNHHEKPDGTGFPKGINSSTISPLSSIFNLSHDFANLYLNEYPSNVEADVLIEKLGEEYRKGNYLKPYNILVKLIGPK